MTSWKMEDDMFVRQNYLTMTAAVIGAKLGRTRNAVIGRALRLGLAKTSKEESKTQERKYEKNNPITPAVNDLNTLKLRPLSERTIESMLALKHNDCRYIKDDGVFCAKEITRGSFCAEHAARCYVDRVRRL